MRVALRFFDETPAMGILRNCVYAIIIMLLYSLTMMLLGHFDAGFLPAYCLVGIGFSFFGWGGERLWYATIANFFKQPRRWYAVLSHVPLWGMFGGISYTVVLLASKKFSFLLVDEIPVKNLFFTGAAIGAFIQFNLYMLDVR
ncbi:MAG: hypothetical protein HYZ33_03750, partial [Ignavibacteriales bacterium]|nr:hypothetical protein [Ignavibacteriales bacterium]